MLCKRKQSPALHSKCNHSKKNDRQQSHRKHYVKKEQSPVFVMQKWKNIAGIRTVNVMQKEENHRYLCKNQNNLRHSPNKRYKG